MKLDSPLGMTGSKSFLGVVQETPEFVRVAFVFKTLPSAENAQMYLPVRSGKLSISSCRVRAVVRWSSCGFTLVIVALCSE